MSPVIITLRALLNVGVLLALWLMGIYNGLVVARNHSSNQQRVKKRIDDFGCQWYFLGKVN